MSTYGASSNRVQVTCVRLQFPGTRSEHITHIGSNGRIWTKAEAIREIDSGRIYFYTRVHNVEARVHVVRPSNGEPYLHTRPDGYGPNNLLELPSC